jgi:hypothetical protein
LVELDVAEKLQKTNHSINGSLFVLLPEWLQVMGLHFLTNLQRLHDGRFFVNKHKDGVIRNLKDHVDFSQIKFPE